MSADGAADAATGADAPDGAAPGFEKHQYGTVDEIRETLGLNDLEDAPTDERPRDEEPADEVAAKRDAKGKFVKTDDADKTKPDKAAKDAKEDDDVATVRAIEARGRARRQAREAARKAAQPAPVASAATASPTTQPAAEKPATAPARAATPVESAVKDVLDQIAALAGNDAAATARTEGAAAPDTAERKAALEAITAKLDELKAGALKSTEEGKKQIEAMQAQLKAIESARIIRRVITKAIDSVADELPTLTDAKAIRAFNKEHNTEYADAAEMIGEAAERYWQKFKVAPDMASLARRIERKLSGKGPEQTEREKPTPKSKTVSRSDGSPPAARNDSDDRTYEEANADFKRRFGLD